VSNVGGRDEMEPIAVVGMACRLPGARDVEELWRNLVDGVVSIRERSRDDLLAAGVPPERLADPTYVPVESALDEPEYFDHELFGMSKRDAAVTDPQIRLFLELANTALEHAGYDPARYAGEIGVYGGVGSNRYVWTHVRQNPQLVNLLGAISLATTNSPDYATTTTSYRLNLQGPSVAVYTACSTSLVAVHMACEALRNRECDMALAGGASIELPLYHGYLHMEGGVESADGRCRPFDAAATGTVWASGGTMVLLKRLSEALTDGDCIHATVLGNAINNDGAGKVGFTAPSIDGQAAVIAMAIAAAGVDPRSIGYLEAHGTATTLGDPIEVAALSSVYGQATEDRGWCALGSIKSNLGHTSQAAGVAGLIKAVLALGRGLIPASLGYESPNPAIDFADSPFCVSRTLSEWDGNRNGAPRRAGVSSFGIGGTNAHVVLQEPPPPVERQPTHTEHLLQVSARTPTALTAAVRRLAGHLTEHPQLNLADVAYTLRVGRRRYPHRVAAVVSGDGRQAASMLAQRVAKGEAMPDPPRLAWLFSGQGTQYAGMGARLYQAEPVFRDVVNRCADILVHEVGTDIRRLLFAAGPDRAAADDHLGRTAFTQPALFTVEYALAQLWQSWGVRPDAMLGHSVGEYVAATVAGVFELPDALRLVALRGRLMEELPSGAMLAVQCAEQDLAGRLPDELAIAAVNGPGAVVVAGTADAVDHYAQRLAADGIGSRKLRTSHAFHSPMMEPILDRFTLAVARTPRSAPRLRFLSNRTGDWITAEQAADPEYWAGHLRETVRFGDCVARLLADGDWVFLECGPGRQLAGLVRMQAGRASTTLPSLPGPVEKNDDLTTCYAAAGELWVRGVELDPATFGEQTARVPLPTYPYERVHCWVEPCDSTSDSASATGPQPTRTELAEWFQVPTWHQLPPAITLAPPLTRCVVFNAGDHGDAVVSALRATETEVIEVRPGSGFHSDAGGLAVRPDVSQDFVALVDALAHGGMPERVVYGWPLDTTADGDLLAAQDRIFFGLLHFVQAVIAADADTTVHIDVLTGGCHGVLGGDIRHPEHATVAGMVLTAGHESAAVSLRHLDCDLDDIDAQQIRDVLRRDPATTANRPLALRRGRLWARSFDATSIAAAPSRMLRDRGVYLITGGLGGLGLAVAEDLAHRLAAQIVLVGRSGLPPRDQWDAGPHGARADRAIAAIRRMESAGAQVLPLAGDVTDPAALRRVREELLAQFGCVNGIVHAAGVAGGGMIEAKAREAARCVLAPKLTGPSALRAAFGDLPLDFVILFSSAAAVLPSIGEVDYIGANAYLDAYAGSAHGWAAPVRSLGWSAWREVGMAAESADFQLLARLASPDSASVDPPAGDLVALDHPVLTELYLAHDGRRGYCRGFISAESHWLLAGHRLTGTPVMPGTGQLETIRAAVAALLPRPSDAHVLELCDVTFVESMAVPDGTTAEVVVQLERADDAVDFTVATIQAGDRRVHTHGSGGWVVPPVTDPIDVAAVRRRCSPRPDAAEEYARWQRNHPLLAFGPQWSCIREGWLGATEELVRLVAPVEAAADYGRWDLHPTMLDAAAAIGRSATPAGGSAAQLPIGYGRLLIHGRVPPEAWVYRRHGIAEPGSTVETSDFSVVDDQGRPVVVVTDFLLRPAGPDTARTAAPSASTSHPAPDASVTGGAETDSWMMATGDALEAFRRALAADLGPHVLIAPNRFADMLRRSTAGTSRTLARLHGDAPAVDVPRSAARHGSLGTDPRSELEAVLARVWALVLDVDEVGADDDFFELGGNSLVAVQLIAQVRKETGVRVPMRSLFDTPTVAGMAGRVADMRGQDR
jgi:phthiocerol/phenolphthiocerol synthesis type-I polyketide synthase E